MAIIPAAASERILKKAGARRVSDEAKKAFSEVLEQLAEEISKKAVDIANNCGRKTINGTDIKMVKV
ncbi:NFYB/HAP3 family transcription factor subunit [Candidatus Woesearchaeota archaeon]|nr:NFYB/HAP3 family transcription factor subunit [Candidatus Woesearchaeota archaeon]